MAEFIKQIQIEKVRHLENLTIDIAEDEMKHLIITGKNGSGKTTLLERIKQFLEIIPDGNVSNIYNEWPKYMELWLKKRDELIRSNIKDLINQDKIKEANSLIEHFESQINHYKNGLEVKFNKNTLIYEKYLEGQFILAYFKATRNAKIDIPKNVPKIQLQDRYGIEQNIGNIFLNYLVYLKTQQSFARNEGDMEEVNRIQDWFERFESALRNLFEDDSISLKFDYKELNFKIQQQNREDYGFNTLPDGYSAVLDIVINLILRMEKQHKQAYDIEGIVLIDELENHLHIGLQKKILPFLTEFFPNVQFIVTTHSPFIINSIGNAVIYDLEKQQAVQDLSGIAYEGIVEAYFNVDQYSEKVKTRLRRYSELVSKVNKSEPEEDEEFELRRYLKSIPSDLAPEVVLAFNDIELTRKSKMHKNQ